MGPNQKFEIAKEVKETDTNKVGWQEDFSRKSGSAKVVGEVFIYLQQFCIKAAWKIVNNGTPNDGLEAWRRLHREYDPIGPVRRVQLLRAIHNPEMVEKNENLGKALEECQTKKRQYEEFTDDQGQPCRVSNDALIAAMFQLMPRSLEDQFLMQGDEERGFDAIFNKLAAYANSKASMAKAKKQPGQPRQDYTPMDVSGFGGKGRGDCHNCGKPGHFARDCRAKGGGKASGKGKDWIQPKGGKEKGGKGK